MRIRHLLLSTLLAVVVPRIALPDNASTGTPATSSPDATNEQALPVSSAPASKDSEKPRTWTDATGKHKTEATLLGLKDGKVRLRKSDGKEVAVPLERLSVADRQYVQGRSKPARGGKDIEVSLVPRERIQGTLVNYQRPSRLDLSDRPAVKLKAEPPYRSKKPLYGCLPLGNAEDNLVCVVLDEPEQGSPRLYIDRNNDRDLTNDGDGALTGQRPDYLELKDVTIQARYKSGTMPYTLNFYRWKSHQPRALMYHRNSAREGEVVLGDAKYKIAILDENGDGRFDDLNELTIFVDSNQSGQLAMANKDEFFLGDMTCKLVSASADGTRLTIHATSDADEPKIAVHLAARDKVVGMEPADEGPVTWYRPMKAILGNKPPVALKAEPAYRSKKPLYGSIALGDAEDNQVVIVLDEPLKGPPRIYIDHNNDRDLTNDGDGAWSSERNGFLNLKPVTIDVRYRSGTHPYVVSIYRNPDRFADSVFYYRNSAREGEVDSGNVKYKILVLDENCDARFDDLQNDRLLVDVNEDGKIEKYPDASMTCAEVMLGAPFKLGDVTLRARSMSPDGTLLTLRLSKTPLRAAVRELSPGEGAPRFAGQGLDGQHIDLNAEKGKWKYILLCFWATDEKYLERFPEIRRVAARYKKDALKIIGVNLDADREVALRSIRAAGLEYPQLFDGKGPASPVAAQYHAVEMPPYFQLPKGIILSTNLRIVDTWCMEQPGQLEQRLVKLLGPGDPSVPIPTPEAPKPVTAPPLPVVREIPTDVSKLTHLALNNKKDIGDTQIERLKDASQLEWLELYGTSVTDSGLKHLAGLTRLKTLLLGQTGITDAGLVHLANITSLKNLQIQKNPGITDRGLEALKRLSDLEALNLFGTSVTDNGLEQLYGLKKLRHVNTLFTRTTAQGIVAAKKALPSCHFGGEDGCPPEWQPSFARQQVFGVAPRLSRATKFTIHVSGDGKGVAAVLEKVKVRFTARKEGERTVFEVDNAGIEHLAGRKDIVAIWFPGATGATMKCLKDMSNLEHVDVLNSGIGDAGVADLQGLTRLKALILGGTGVSDQGLALLKGLTDLDTLDLLGGRGVTDAGLEHLRRFKKLKALNLNNTEITDAGLKVVAGLTQLESLSIARTKVTDQGLALLQPLQKLTSLDIGGNPITDDGLPAIAKLRSLRVLRLSATKVTDEGLEHLKSLKNLQELDVFYSYITNDGLKHLKGLPGLRALNLALSHVDDEGTEHLAEFAGLETLQLYGTQVSDAGLRPFAKMSRLRILTVNKNTVSDAAIAKLKRAIPNCDIKSYADSRKPPMRLK